MGVVFEANCERQVGGRLVWAALLLSDRREALGRARWCILWRGRCGEMLGKGVMRIMRNARAYEAVTDKLHARTVNAERTYRALRIA
eukprot:369957-Pyramimonas_sp.AAC.1